MPIPIDVRQLRARSTLNRTVNVLTVLGLPHVRSLLPDLITGLQLANTATNRRIWLTNVRIAIDVRQLRARSTLDRTVNVLTVLGLPHVRSLLPDSVTGLQLANTTTARLVVLTDIGVAVGNLQCRACWTLHGAIRVLLVLGNPSLFCTFPDLLTNRKLANTPLTGGLATGEGQLYGGKAGAMMEYGRLTFGASAGLEAFYDDTTRIETQSIYDVGVSNKSGRYIYGVSGQHRRSHDQNISSSSVTTDMVIAISTGVNLELGYQYSRLEDEALVDPVHSHVGKADIRLSF